MEEELMLCRLLNMRQLEYFTEIVLRRMDNNEFLIIHSSKKKEHILAEMQKIVDGEQESMSIDRCAIGDEIESEMNLKFCYDVNQVDINRLSKVVDSDIIKIS